MEVIKYSFLGLHLQEPMALVTNGLIALFSFWAFFSLKRAVEISAYWKRFFLIIAVSMVFGAIGHTFFEYFGLPGKIPSWTLGVLSNAFIGFCLLQYDQKIELSNPWVMFVVLKSFLLLTLAVVRLNFLFIAIDTIVSYLLFTGYYAFRLKKMGLPDMKYMVIGVGILLPSAFIFLLKINPSRWFDKNDLSHVLMLGGLICFYLGAKKTAAKSVERLEHV